MNTIKKFFTSKEFEAFLWMTANGFIGVVATYLAGLDWAYALPVIAVLNILTKYINTTYIKQ